MSILDLRALATGICGSVLGVPVTVTPPGGSAVTTRGIWQSSQDEPQPFGTDIRRVDRRRLMSIVATATLTDVPRGSTVVAEESVGISRTWRVDGYAAPLRPETIPVVMVPVT